ncbi:hypothetical protein [Streptomyces sp. NBC_00280]|uniref:hypothetical protein n=1 Tax=Streptomyces sp. NBC_00280 TaxID=2975699 RepID=UPI0032434232
MTEAERWKALAQGGRLTSTLRAEDRVTRFRPDIEYEVKLDAPDHSGDDPGELLNLVCRDIADGHLLLDACGTRAQMSPRYLLDGTTELSLFRYEGKDLLKIKNHEVLDVAGCPVMRSFEAFRYGRRDIDAELARRDARPVGGLHKLRAKNFLLDLAETAVYSIAATVCVNTSGDVQRQVEIEYFGTVRPDALPTDEGDCVSSLVAVAQAVRLRSAITLTPTSARKFDLVRVAAEGRHPRERG